MPLIIKSYVIQCKNTLKFYMIIFVVFVIISNSFPRINTRQFIANQQIKTAFVKNGIKLL